MKKNKVFTYFILGKLRRLYFMSLPETESDMEKSRRRFAVGEASAGVAEQVAGGVFIVFLMSYVGISDANIGILTSFASLSALVQVFALSFIRKLKKSKLLNCIVALQRIWLGIMFLIPLLNISIQAMVILIISCYLLSRISVQVGSPPIQEWVASLVPMSIRGKYFASKDIINVLSAAFSLLLVGWIVDYFKVSDNSKAAFFFIGIFIIILTVVSFTFYSMVHEPKIALTNERGHELHGSLAKKKKQALEEQKEKHNFFKDIIDAFKMKSFRKYFFLEFFWITTFFISMPFNASYSVKELNLSYSFISIVLFASNILRVLITKKMGALGDKKGMAKILNISIISLAIHFLIWSFMTPNNALYMYILTAVFACVSWSFLGIGLFNIKLQFVHPEKRVVQFTILSAILGPIGFLISLVSARLLDFLQKNPVQLFGEIVYAQQILNMASFIISVLMVLYIRFVVQKENVEINELDGKVI